MSRARVLDMAPDLMMGDVVASFFFEDQRPLSGSAALLDWRLNGALTRLLLDGEVTGNPGEYILIGNNGKLQASWVLFAGGGCRSQLAPFTYAGLIGGLLDHCRRAGFHRISLCLTAPENGGEGWVRELAEELAGVSRKEEIFLTIRETTG